MLVSDPLFPDFRGTVRFAVRRTLGSGGMGVVYHAYDRTKGMDVALKTLRELDADAIYRLKKEFRALSEVSHPNLVTLHELISEGGQWFITMELVRGSSFLEFIHRPEPIGSLSDTLDVSAATVAVREGLADASARTPITDDSGDLDDTHADSRSAFADTLAPPARRGLAGPARSMYDDTATASTLGDRSSALRPLPAPVSAKPSGPNLTRLRIGMRQLTEGLCALHDLGKLHRDIKPSNVLVTPAGRVVILDFGLVTELFPDINKSGTENSLAGTLAYMAPETGGPEPLTAAADWYSVGVMLYEALSGRLPFAGSGVDVLLRKQREDPPALAELAPRAPPELVALCTALLSRDPKARPSGEQVLRALGAPARSSSAVGAQPRGVAQHGPFIGRHLHLGALESAFAASQSGRPIAVFVRGASGIGKTALLRCFLDELKQRESAVILSGKCYERETVPFKALDSLVDSLSRYLARLPQDELSEILPRSIRALARIFPVLMRVEAVERSPKLPAETPDQQELRRRAFRTLRELLGRIAAQHPVVMFIDDLQWGDADSAAMLLDLLRPPDAPPFLLLACHRSDDEAQNPVLREMMRAKSEHGGDVRFLTVGALSAEEARDLALTLLHQNGLQEDESAAERIARESEGNPFFIDALVRHSRKESKPGTDPEFSLGRVLQARLSRLTKPSRRFLEIIAIAGRPVPLELAGWASGTASTSEQTILTALRAANLIRTHSATTGEVVEPYHDRIREAVLSQLNAEALAERHRALAEAMESHDSIDIESLCFHFREAGEHVRAAAYAERAGEQAVQALAFDRAARLFQIALEHSTAQSVEVRRHLTAQLGDALAFGGRGADAAQAYLEAAKGATDLEAINLQRLAAEQLLISGHVDRGIRLLKEVLAAAGFKLAKTPRRAYLNRVLRRGKIWRRGFDFVERPIERVAREDLTRIDILWSAVTGLVLTDFIRGADFQTDHVLLALDVGEPYRVARALALEACYVGTGGSHGQWRTAKLIEAANELAHRIAHPHAIGLASLAEGVAAFLEGHWSRARVLLERTEEILRDRCAGVIWELVAARLLHNSALFHLGQIAALTQRVPLIIDEAELRGDLFTGTLFSVGHATSVALAKDTPERALRQLDEAMARWSQRGYHVQHGLAALGRTRALLYAGHGEEAYRRLSEEWPKMVDHYLLKTQYLRVESLCLRAHAALAAAREATGKTQRSDLLTSAGRDVRAIEREGMRWSQPQAELLAAGLAELRGRDDEARKAYETAAAGFAAANMTLFEATARLRLGRLLGGAAGEQQMRAALARFTDQGIKDPSRFADSLGAGGAP